MSRSCSFTLVAALVAVATPALAQSAGSAKQQLPPYSKEITQQTTTTTTQTTDPNVTTQQPAPPPAQNITVQPAPPPAQNITVQPAPSTPPPPANVIVQPAPAAPPPSVTVVPPPQPVVEQHPVNVSVVPVEKPAPMMAISLGGGITEFADSQIRDRTGVNGEYEARLTFGVSSPLAFEAAYVGTAVGIQGLAGESNATLLSNGVEGLARVNIGTYEVQPFVVGGASWVRYSVVDTNVSLSDVKDTDDVLALPFGAGIAGYIPDTGFMADARFVYRATFNDDLVRPTVRSSAGAGLGNWNISLRLGYVF